MNDYKLKNRWTFWYHSINDNNWKINSYHKLYSIENIYDYKIIEDSFKNNHYYNGMYFIMRNDIKPIWEDPMNRMGGYISFKIYSNDLINKWNYLIKKCIMEDIFIDNNDYINGISISPKKEFNILKIWLNRDIPNYKEYIQHLEMDISKVLYKRYS